MEDELIMRVMFWQESVGELHGHFIQKEVS